MKSASRSIPLTRNGFIFPFVLLLSLIFLSATTISINLYTNHQTLTKLHHEKTIIQTLVQSGLTKFKSEMGKTEELSKIGEELYIFPHGEVLLQYEWMEARTYNIQVTITTEQGMKNTFRKVYDV